MQKQVQISKMVNILLFFTDSYTTLHSYLANSVNITIAFISDHEYKALDLRVNS